MINGISNVPKIEVESITTKFGTARKQRGYWQISSKKEGNNNKLLHRLIYEDFYKCTLLNNAIIHHKDKNGLNNNLENLELMTHSEHSTFHGKTYKPTTETKEKISKTLTGRTFSDNHCENLSKSLTGRNLSSQHKRTISKRTNTTNYQNVTKHKDNHCKQGFSWRYQYYDGNGKRKSINRVNLEDLEKEVKSRGLDWIKLVEDEYNAMES